MHANLKTIFVLTACAVVFFTPGVRGQDEGLPPSAPSPQFKQRALQFMISTDAAKRQAAYRSWLQLDASAMPSYREALDAAATHHSRRLDELCRDRANPYKAFNEAAEKLATERPRVMELIKTDWKKDSAKVKMLRQEMTDLEKLWSQVNRLAAANTRTLDANLDAVVAALCEVAREKERFDSESETKDMDEGELRAHVLREHIYGRQVLEQRERMEATRKEAATLAEVEKTNAAAGRWASPAMKTFATILNKERAIVGITPLVMDEKLSAACEGHSKDMATLGFFAHESPVEGKKSPWDRARLAGFEGSGASENIFAGSTSPNAAYDAWFASDGHRFNMFGNANTLGVGVSGSHWTMMGGNK
jgi:uncharacterized protein YkwD